MTFLDKVNTIYIVLRKAAKLDPTLIVREITEKKQDALIADILIMWFMPKI